MCASTRFPEAVPLRNITTKTVVQALTKFFTLVGLPKSIQSDQGSNFMSGIFQQVMHELQIKQYKSTAYHPESQGALERFHQTLKKHDADQPRPRPLLRRSSSKIGHWKIGQQQHLQVDETPM